MHFFDAIDSEAPNNDEYASQSSIDFTNKTMTVGEIIPSVKIHNHEYNSKPVWTWNGFDSARAVFTCSEENCDHTYTVICPADPGTSIVPHPENNETCTEPGDMTYTASFTFNKKDYSSQNTDYGVIGALGHSKQHFDAKAATCTENGNDEYWYCSRCNKYFSNEACQNEINKDSWVIGALGHSKQHFDAKAATCTENGNDEYWYCSRCNKYFSNEACQHEINKDSWVIEALGHSYIGPDWNWATDYSSATATFTCNRTGCIHSHPETDSNIEESISELGETIYIAKINFNNQDYIDSRIVAPFEHKFVNHDKYLYRVGNQGLVSISSIFNPKSGFSPEADKIDVTFTPITNNNVSIDKPTNNPSWEDYKIQFNNSGVGTLNLFYDNSQVPVISINLEVVDAVNATSAINATSNNVVLLNDISASSIEISNYFALYGNGFKITFSGYGQALEGNGLSMGYVSISNGNLDNAQIIAPLFPKAYLYVNTNTVGEYVTNNNNLYEIDSKDPKKKRYAYQVSAVKAAGVSKITNSYIYGARNNVLGSGTLTIDNCVLSNGVVSNIHFNSTSGSLSLNDVTTIQYKRDVNNKLAAANVDETVTALGLGILMGPRPDKDETVTSNALLRISGYLKQYNWVCAQDGTDINSSQIAERFISAALQQSNYVSTSNNVEYVNMGIIYMNNANKTINDSRLNHGYVSGTISITGISGQVYAPKSNSEDVEFKDENYEYTTIKNSTYIPNYSISNLLVSQPEEDSFVWFDSGEAANKLDDRIVVQFPSDQTFNFIPLDYISYERYANEEVHVDVYCSLANSNNNELTFNKPGNSFIVIEVSNSKIYNYEGEYISTVSYSLSIPISVSITEASWKDASISIDGTNTSGVTISNNGNRYYWFDIFDGIHIVDYDINGNEEIVLNGNNNDSKKAFINKIVSMTPNPSDLCGANNAAPCYFKFTLNDGRIFEMTAVRVNTTNNPGEPYGAELNISGGLLYYVTKNGAAYTNTKGTAVSNKISSKEFYVSYMTKDYIFTGFSGKPVSNSGEHIMSCGKNGGTWYEVLMGTKPENNYNQSIQNTVSFDANGGKCGQMIGHTSSTLTTITLPSASRVGWTFDGWYTSSNGGVCKGKAGDNYIPTMDTTLYAHWKAPFIVSFDSNGGNQVSQIIQENGSQIELPTVSRDGYYFLGWYDDDLRVGSSGGYYIVPENDVTLVAHWTTDIVVIFDPMGGSASSSIDFYNNIDPIVLPTVSRNGYRFNGWYTAANGGTKVGNSGSNYEPTESITIYAQWNAYTVSFDGNGVTNPNSLSTNANGYVSLPTLSRTGYTFNGWYTLSSGGTKIGNGDSSYTPPSDICLYAQWTAKTYKITITTDSSTTTVTVNGTPVNNCDFVAYDNIVKVVLSYSKSNDQTFSVKCGSNNVPYYSNEDCTSPSTSKAAGTYYFKMPAGEVTIESSSSCLSAETLITLSNGLQKRVDELTGNEEIMVWDFYTGTYSSSNIFTITNHGERTYEVLSLSFANNYELEIISEHGLYDYTLGKFINIDKYNVEEYLNHDFATLSNGSYVITKLCNYSLYEKVTSAYSIISSRYLNVIANNIITLDPSIYFLYPFEIDDNLQINIDSMNADIETFGLLAYEDFKQFAPFMTENQFYEGCGQYIYIALGKGIITMDEIVEYAQRLQIDQEYLID